MVFEVTVLGSSSAIPAHGRHPSAQLLNIHNKLYLVDCGEGTQMRLQDFKLKSSRIDHILISHLHGDHYFGLIGLITTYNLLGREQPLTIYSHAPLEDIINIQLDVSNLILKYPLKYVRLPENSKERILETGSLEVFAFPLQHRIPCCGFIFNEKQPQRNFIKESAEKYGIPYTAIPSIKQGADYADPSGRVIPNDELTTPAITPRTYIYMSDSIYSSSFIPMIKGADLVYHEATFLHELEERATETFHSTARQAAELAKSAGIKKLLLGHYSAKYKDLDPLLREAKEVFPDTELAEEGVTYQV